MLAALLLPAAVAEAQNGRQRKAKPCRATSEGPVYRTPGYRGVCRSPLTAPADPLPSIVLGEGGRQPQALVDEAGTAHIVWNQDGGDAGPDVLRYCRLKRGGGACDNPTGALSPDQPGEPAFNEDLGGPRIVAVGDDLAFITHRYPNVVDQPDGASSRTTYMWTSDDGGNTITGPAIVGDAEPSGGAVVFGSPEAPRIGLISDTRTGGTFFQSIAPGAYNGAEANLGDAGPDQAYSGSLISVGGLPLAAFADLQGNTLIRQWSGSGDPADPGTWTRSQTTGSEPRLAAGPGGAFLVTSSESESLQVRRLEGTSPGAPTTVKTGARGSRDVFADSGGTLQLAWVDTDAEVPELIERASGDGRRFGAARVLARTGPSIDQVDLGATFDGGGFALYAAGASTQGYGRILAAPFGLQTATGRPGIGNLPGGGADPGTVTTCQEVSYRAVQMLTDFGCLLTVPGKPGVKVTEGALRLNGLEIVPDAGVRILVGARTRTIDTTGRVTVQLRANGGPIVLFRGELHVDLPSGAAGTRLFGFDAADFPVNVKGFPVSGDIDVILRQEAVEIPVELRLPKAFGGLTGSATLRADNRRGLAVDSVRFRVPELPLGPLVLSAIDISWTNSSNTWSGSAGARLLGAGMDAALTFRDGDFVSGTATITPVPFPGVKLAPDVFLNRISGTLSLDPAFVEAGALFGVQPLAPPDVYAYTAHGRLRVTIAPRFAFELSGEGAIASIPVSEARVYADIDGHFALAGAATFDLPAVAGHGRFDGWFDAPRGLIGGKIDVTVTLGGSPVAVDIGAQALVSNEMVAACKKPLGGFAYSFATRSADVSVGSCPGEPPIPAWAAGGPAAQASASAAQAGPPTFELQRDLPAASLQVSGVSGAPDVALIAPSGERVVPVPISDPGAAQAAAVFARTPTTTAIGLRRPAGGTWRIEEAQPGSVAKVAVARELPAPRIRARVTGRGRKRALAYRATARKGLVVRFVERIGRGGRQIAVGRAARGRIRFRAGDGRGGRRAIVAQAEQNGMPLLQKRVATYRAPGPIRPARVRGLRVRRSGQSVAVRWKRARGTDRYVVRVRVSDGRRLLKLVGGRSLRIGGVARDETVRVTVSGRNAKGREGAAARKRLARKRR